MAAEAEAPLEYDTVRVIRQEAVGMYEVAVLAAGSAKALQRWMDEHGYKFPKGMDTACNDYIDMGWAFVAVKTRVGSKSQIDPKPGMRAANPNLPAGSSFDGAVQGMGFRFKVDKPVIPMRLSTFNEGELHNVVYLLTDKPSRLAGIPTGAVRRQVSGRELYRNVTDLLPLRILGGTIDDVSRSQIDSLKARRDPTPHNGQARDLFASDLFAARTKKLSLDFEEKEKELLRIGESLNLRGAQLDVLHDAALADERKKSLGQDLSALKRMTMTIIDGDFPRDYLRDNNLVPRRFKMKVALNSPANYEARSMAPLISQGVRHPPRPGSKGGRRPWWKMW